MAEVFKAEHRHLGQIRGLKVLLPDVAAQPELLDRLLTEARTMARLRHPTIAEVYDCDVQGDSAFIVMEYLPGITLRTWSDHVGKLARNPTLAAAVVGTLADGLAFAHQHGVVHRDLKPENVLLVAVPGDDHGFSLKILDFGAAKLVREPPVITPAHVSRDQPAKATQHGHIIGTPLYMAPEQWRAGGRIDNRADIYALGCVLFELLCGRPPFCENDVPAIMRAPSRRRTTGHHRPRTGDTVPLPGAPGADAGEVTRRSPASMQEVLAELEGYIGSATDPVDRDASYARHGVMSARGTLVINLQQTIVQRVGLRGHLLQNIGRLAERHRELRLVWARLRERAAGLSARQGSALRIYWRRMLTAKTIRLAIIVCLSATVAGTVLGGIRLLVRAGRHLAVPEAGQVTGSRTTVEARAPISQPRSTGPVSGNVHLEPAIAPPAGPLSATSEPTDTDGRAASRSPQEDSPSSSRRRRAVRPRPAANVYRPVGD
jgi:serine/threonine protein kinase